MNSTGVLPRFTQSIDVEQAKTSANSTISSVLPRFSHSITTRINLDRIFNTLPSFSQTALSVRTLAWQPVIDPLLVTTRGAILDEDETSDFFDPINVIELNSQKVRSINKKYFLNLDGSFSTKSSNLRQISESNIKQARELELWA